jgi:hypothetical protein
MGFYKITFFLLLATGLFANAIKDPFFGYKSFKETDANKEDKFDKFNIVVTDELLDTLTPEEFEALNENIKKVAVKRQKEQDIKNFLIIKNYTQKKADEFTKKTQIIALKNQDYDLSLNIAKSKFAKNVQNQANTKENQDFWQNIKDNSIIVVFYDETKEVENRAVEMVLNYAYQERGLQGQFMSISEGFGQQFAQEQNIKFTPDIWILFKGKKPIWHRLASGVITQNRIYEQIEFVYENVIKKELEK